MALVIPTLVFATTVDKKLRIISLAPHITEILFKIGAGDLIVGTVSYSDYPAAAKTIPEVGGYNRLNMEAILELSPDIVLGWSGGNSKVELDRLRSLGLNLSISNPQKLEDVARLMKEYGNLAGVDSKVKEQAILEAEKFYKQVAKIKSQFQGKKTVTVFYQVWSQPLLTINGEQLINHVIEYCGGVNVFNSINAPYPQISVEAVLEKNPDVIIVSGMGVAQPEWLDRWKKYLSLSAVQKDNLFTIHPNILQRHGPRIIQGLESLCGVLEKARTKD